MADTNQYEHLKIQLETITSATNNFADDNCIGSGGFGKVYKGEIVHSKGKNIVALKRLDRKFGQGDTEFWKEIMLLFFYRHEHIVSLLGYCNDSGEKILAYEYTSKRSLDRYLKSDELTWVQRPDICIGAARGLAYLHTPTDTKLRILHRDIKSSNILLDDNWNAKIADFGLSKFAPANNQFSYLVTNAVGTIGYCDPVYVETGLLTKESDVYSFGVVLFEVLCGRLCFGNSTRKPLIELVQECFKENRINEIIFGKIKDEIKPYSLDNFTSIAYQCINRDRKKRPRMSEVVKALKRALEYQVSSEFRGTGGIRIYGIFFVTVLAGSGFGDSNIYVTIRLTATRNFITQRHTQTKHGNMSYEWNENFVMAQHIVGDVALVSRKPSLQQKIPPLFGVCRLISSHALVTPDTLG